MSKRIQLKQESRKNLIVGINAVADAVSVTMGAMGRNVVIQRTGKAPLVTKDGFSVAKEVFLFNPEQDMGAQMIKGVSARTVEDTGDGTTTATVLARAMVNAGQKYLDEGSNPIDLKRGINTAVKAVTEYLANLSQPIETKEQVKQVASLSANNDEEIGEIIEHAISKVSREGTITVEESKTVDTYVDVVEGLKLHRGFTSAGFVTNVEKGTAVLNNPLIFMSPNNIDNITSFLPVLNTVPEGRSLLIIAGDISGEATSTLVINKIRGGWQVASIKAPFLGEKRMETLSDLAVVVGGTVVSEAAGLTFEDFEFEMFGSCDKAIIDKDSTIIVGGHGAEEDVVALKETLRAQISEVDSKFETEEIKKRLALISGGVAVLYVGASSEIEMREKRDRIDDALGATRAAIEEGIVSGGGIALLNSVNTVAQLSSTNQDIEKGFDIVIQALMAPLETIIGNAGLNYKEILTNLSDMEVCMGFDVKSGTYCNMVESGIIDPKKVTRVALENAASVASLVLMTECTIVNGD